MTLPSFSVCALVREEPDILERFARHFLGLGAERVRFYFDGEAHEAHAPDLAGVELTVCDRTWWDRRIGRQPSDFDDGLRAVFREAHESATSDWQFFCDADEYLVCGSSIAELLARVPEDCPSLRILNAEAVWGPGDVPGSPFGSTWFRTVLSPRKEALMRRLLPWRRWSMFRQGLVGHRGGKHFLRRGAIVDGYNSHRSLRDGTPIGLWADKLGLGPQDVFLAHFDAISEPRWTEKWRRRLSQERPSAELGPQRLAQLEAIRAASEAGTLPELFRELYGLSRYEATILQVLGGVIRRQIFVDRGAS